MKLPIYLSQQEFASRKTELVELGLTAAQVDAMANGTAAGEGPCKLGPSWVIEVDEEGWALVCADTDATGKKIKNPLDEQYDCAPVWLNTKGRFVYGPVG